MTSESFTFKNCSRLRVLGKLSVNQTNKFDEINGTCQATGALFAQ